MKDALIGRAYIVRHDHGFAPNPQGAHLTLACCKPVIRRMAEQKQWVIGIKPRHLGDEPRMIYAMRIDEKKLTFDEYFRNPKFEYKKPSNENPEGDNRYYRRPQQGAHYERTETAHKYHMRQADMQHDIGKNEENDKVLISSFDSSAYYFGMKDAIRIPERFWNQLEIRRNHRNLYTTDIFDWLIEKYAPGNHSSFNKRTDTKKDGCSPTCVC